MSIHPTTTYDCPGTAQLILPIGSILMTVHTHIQNISMSQILLRARAQDNKPATQEDLFEIFQPKINLKIQLLPDDSDASISILEASVNQTTLNQQQNLLINLSILKPNDEFKELIYGIK